MVRAEFGKAVRELRVRQGLTQRELAEKLGVTEGYISKLETGKLSGSPHLARRIATALELSIDEALYLESLAEEGEGAGEFVFPVLMATSVVTLQSGLAPKVLMQLGVDPWEKTALARFLATALEAFCPNDQTTEIYIDSGTTMLYVAHHIAKSRLGLKKPVKLFTGNLLGGQVLLGSAPVYLLGGRVDHEFGATLGSESIKQLRSLMDKWAEERDGPRVAFVSCLAFSGAEGPYARTRLVKDPFRATRGTTEGITHHQLSKQIPIESVPYLVVAFTSSKLERPREPQWSKVAGPIGPKGAVWLSRIKGIKPVNAFTHVVMTCPSWPPRHLELWKATIKQLLDLGFQPTKSLFGCEELGGGRNRNFFTLVDASRGVALDPSDVQSFLT